jgi:hypothetical protein
LSPWLSPRIHTIPRARSRPSTPSSPFSFFRWFVRMMTANRCLPVWQHLRVPGTSRYHTRSVTLVVLLSRTTRAEHQPCQFPGLSADRGSCDGLPLPNVRSACERPPRALEGVTARHGNEELGALMLFQTVPESATAPQYRTTALQVRPSREWRQSVRTLCERETSTSLREDE